VPVAYFYCEEDILAELILELGKLDTLQLERKLQEFKQGK